MEYINMSEAARRSGLSTKTLQRAIKAGELHEAPRLQDNQARIAVDELERWLAARQSTEGDEHLASMKTLDPETRLAELEQTVQRLQEDYRNDQLLGVGHDPLALGPADDAYTQNRIDALEQTLARMQEQAELDQRLLSNRMDTLEKRMNEQSQLLLSTQEALAREQQETESLRRRIAALEVANDPLGEEKAKLRTQETGALSPGVEQDTAVYELADFSQLLQPIYRSNATRGDVKAWLNLRPEPQGIEGDYSIAYFEMGRADGQRGQLKRGQMDRGNQLKQDLRTKVVWSLIQAGWTKGPHDIFVCPVGK